MNRACLALTVLAVLASSPACRDKPTRTSGSTAAPTPAETTAEARSETTVEVVIGETPEPVAAPTFAFDWPRGGRLGVHVTTTLEWSAPEAGDQETSEEATWTWTLAGADGGELRMASAGTPRSLVARADGSLVSSTGDAEADLWGRLVGRWAGRSADVGSRFEDEGVLEVVGFDGANGPARLRFAVLGRVPCRERTRDLRCTELEIRGELTADDALLAELRGRVKGERSLRDVEVLEHARLRTVGSSLQPHRLQIERITRLRFRAADGTEQTERIREDRVYTFDWTP